MCERRSEGQVNWFDMLAAAVAVRLSSWRTVVSNSHSALDRGSRLKEAV